MSINLNKMRLKFFISIALVGCIVSCSENRELRNEVNKLELEKSSLIKEIDSLKELLNSESLTPVVFANRYNGYYTESNEMEFAIALCYNRPELIRSLSYDIFSSEDSLDIALFEDNTLLKETINLNEFDGIIACSSGVYPKGTNYFGGVFSIQSMGKERNIPFKYQFEYK